ncbi:MAG: hypothetical protein NTX59_03250 [Elusimicrobia bacterium]|nr:hypothetical protein [Elusimicrobiota bacterium]
MDDSEKKPPKPGIPPLPPGILRPGLPLPQPGARPAPVGGLGLPNPFAQNSPPQFQSAAAYPDARAQQAASESAAETARMKEEKDKLEKKILEMEKLLSQEKERALLATLKNQQDETLSSKVESSLKDIQDRMRRDKRDQEVEEERLTFKGKIKELETRLMQERETWMQSLKGQVAERETQGRDVEGHFIYRLQEMERRWLDEKAQWQKEISSREDAIRSLKSSAERLREVEDEFRSVSLEKSLAEKEISKLRDDVARAEREKASIESYIKAMPEKERELAELRSEAAILKMKEERTHSDFKHQEEKYLLEIEKLQRELGGLSDKKNSEKTEELRAQMTRHEALLQEKDKTIAEVSGDKVRAISEMLKIKGFVSKVQAINAVLDKERGQLRIEKMQLAQNMAAQLEEIKKLRQEQELFKASHHGEIEEFSKKYSEDIEKIKTGMASEFARQHTEKIAELSRKQAEKIAELSRQRDEKIAELSRQRDEKITELSRQQDEKIGKLTRAHMEEMSSYAAKCQADHDLKLSELRSRLERSSSDFKAQIEAEYAAKFKQLKELAVISEGEKTHLEIENRRFSEKFNNFERVAASKQEELAAKAEAQYGALASQKAELEKYVRAFENERSKMAGDLAYVKNQLEAERSKMAGDFSAAKSRLEALAAQKSAAEAELARLSGQLRTESANRAGFEAEMLSLKNRVRDLEQAAAENESLFASERDNAEAMKTAARAQLADCEAKIAELSGELEKYKAVESSLGSRLKWAIKGKTSE